jgi:hypothetical protein
MTWASMRTATGSNVVNNTIPPPSAWIVPSHYLCVRHATPYAHVPQKLGLLWVCNQITAILKDETNFGARLKMTRRLVPHMKFCCMVGDETMDALANKFKQRTGGLSANLDVLPDEWDGR